MISKTQMIVAGVALLALACIKPIAFLLGVVVLCIYLLFILHDAPAQAPQQAAAPIPGPVAPVVSDPGPYHEPEPVAVEIAPDDRYIPPQPIPLPAWHAPLLSLVARLAPFCSEAIKRIGLKTFELNPLLTPDQTRFAGLINSATLQHGILIEKAILECLQDREDLAVWCEPHFRLSHGDTNYHKAVTVEGAAFAQLPYGDGDAKHRTVQVDLIVYDKKSNVVCAYEIKRKNEDSISAQNLQIVRSLLMSYAETVKQLKPTKAEAWTISYYGEPSHKGGDWRLTRGDLNSHFGSPVVEAVEGATATYRDDLQTILNASPLAERAAA